MVLFEDLYEHWVLLVRLQILLCLFPPHIFHADVKTRPEIVLVESLWLLLNHRLLDDRGWHFRFLLDQSSVLLHLLKDLKAGRAFVNVNELLSSNCFHSRRYSRSMRHIK